MTPPPLSHTTSAELDFVNSLRNSMPVAFSFQENCVEFEASVVAQVDNLIEALRTRKQQLIAHIQEERDHKLRVFKEQLAHCTQRLQKTTGLIQFSIEVLKESDPAAFLQVCGFKYICLC